MDSRPVISSLDDLGKSCFAPSCLSFPVCTQTLGPSVTCRGHFAITSIGRGEEAQVGAVASPRRLASKEARSELRRGRAARAGPDGLGRDRRRLRAWGPRLEPRAPSPRVPRFRQRQNKSGRLLCALRVPQARPSAAALRLTQRRRAFAPFHPSALGSFRRGRRRWRGRGGGRAW